jgi:predicted phosphodiesterase
VATYGLISDVHGNLEALHAVLVHLERQGVDHIVALGDLVGYNADSNDCVEVVRARGIDCVAGNHDLIALGQLGFDRCAPRPEFSLRRTRRELDAGSRRFLAGLPPVRIYEDRIVLIHGGIDDVSEYMRTPNDIGRNAAVLRARWPRARLCLFGHTHEPALFQVDGTGRPQPFGPEETPLVRDRLTFLNPGSVDAARRTEKLAEVAVLDSERWTVKFQRVAYDDAKAERRAVAGHYRMNQLDEVIMNTRRLARRGTRKAIRMARAALGRAAPGPRAEEPS